MKRTKIVLALLLLAVMLTSSFALVACDKTPAKYKMKNFYGTYDQFANDYYTVYFFLNGKQGTTDLTMRWWDICELKENSFIYIDFSGEKKERECDAVLIAKIRELQQRIGHKVTIEKKKITIAINPKCSFMLGSFYFYLPVPIGEQEIIPLIVIHTVTGRSRRLR